jgi:uncharacterized protein RhaS with RHS repeats
MSPDLGRFLQADPIGFKGDGSNLYRYCHNDPADFSDPTGLIDAQWSKEMWLHGNSPYSFNKLMEMHTDQPAGNISMGLVSKDEGAKGGKPKNGGLMPLPPELLGRMYETHQQNVEKANDKGNWTPIPGTIKSIQEEYATGIYRKGNGLVQDGPNKGWHEGIKPKSEAFRQEYSGGGTRAAATHVHVTGNGRHLPFDREQAITHHYISGTGSASAPGRLDIFVPLQSGRGGQYFHTDDGVHLDPGH